MIKTLNILDMIGLIFFERSNNKQKKEKEENKKNNTNEKYVYHVANPDVKGIIFEDHSETHCKVRFEKPVGFSMASLYGLRFEWICSKNLLFDSPEEARRNHYPNWTPKN